jgi:hypothetical protein
MPAAQYHLNSYVQKVCIWELGGTLGWEKGPGGLAFNLHLHSKCTVFTEIEWLVGILGDLC